MDIYIIMKHFTVFIVLTFFLVSCRNAKDKSEGQLVLNFEAQTPSTFFSNNLFGKVELIPLETKDDCLVGREPVALLFDNHHFFIKDDQQEIIFRFDRTGKFINTIGQRGMGPEEYSAIYDLYIDTVATVVEIVAQSGQMMRYDYDGKFISKQNYDESLLSFIKTGNHYWFYTHQITGDDRLMKVSGDGTVIAKFLPSKTNWMPVIVTNYFDQCGDWITWKDMFSHTVFRITDEGPVETTVIDFGKHAIPERLYKMDMRDAIQELNSKDYAGIFKYLENDQFIYLFFFIVGIRDLPNDHYHWIVNKKTGNSVLHKLLPDSHTSDDNLFRGAKALTADNKLIFMMSTQMLNDPFFSNADSIKSSLTEESNPVIVILQVNDF